MLNITKSVSFNGQSKIGDKVVAYLNANISDNGSTSVTKTIQDQTLYLQNKKDVNADMAEFENTVFGGIE